MADDTPWAIVLVAATFFVAGMVKGVTGMGLPTVAMAILGAILSPVSAAALLLAPSFVTNGWQLFTRPGLAMLLRRLWPMMGMLVIGTIAGSPLLAAGSTALATAALGATLTTYAGHALAAPQVALPTEWERWLSPLAGMATGLVSGATGIFVIPAVPYLQAIGFEKDELVQALGLSFTVSTIALAAALAWRGAFPLDHAIASLSAVPPALVGMWVGQAIRKVVAPATFRKLFLVCLLLLGVELLWRSIRLGS